MPGVFETMYTAGPSGVVTVPCLSNLGFRSIGSLGKLLGDGSVWILVTSGSLNSNSTSARTSLVPKPCPVVMHSPVTGLFRVLLDRLFLLPTIRPRFQEQRTTGHTQSALHSALQCMEDGLLR